MNFFMTLLLLLHFICISHAQESPFYDLPKFSSIGNNRNATYRTNVCNQQRLLFNNQIALRDALQGLNLSVAMTNYANFFEKNFFELVDGKIKETSPGLFVVIMDELAQRAGFQWRNSFCAVDPVDPTTDGDKSWSDLLEWEVQNFDIAADYWARSVERMARGISFPAGWYSGSIVIVTSVSKDGNKVDLWSFLVPFEFSVWSAMAAAIFFTGLMYFFLERLNSNADESKLGEKPLIAIFMAATAFTGHCQFQPQTNAARILSFSWTFWALIMASAYTANMASFLVSKNGAGKSVSTVEDALTTGTPVCVQRGAIMDEILSDKYPELGLVRKGSEAEMFQGLNKPWYGGGGGCGVLMTNLGTYDVYHSQKETNAGCTLSSDKRVVLNLPAGFATAVDSAIMCTSLISYVLDLHLAEMHNDGFIEQAWANHLSAISTASCPEGGAVEKSEKFSLSLKDMGGIFITHAILSLVALALAFYQYFHAKLRNPTKNLRPISMKVLKRSLTANMANSSNVDMTDSTFSEYMRRSKSLPQIDPLFYEEEKERGYEGFASSEMATKR